jgi:hypothetical protein
MSCVKTIIGDRMHYRYVETANYPDWVDDRGLGDEDWVEERWG